MKKRILAALLCITLLSLAACSKDTGEGKVFRYPLDAMPQRLDPSIAAGAEELLIIQNCFEGLVRQDAEGALVPGAAASWEVSTDGLTYTFHLREDTHWRLHGDVNRSDSYWASHPDYTTLLGGKAQVQAFDTQVTAEDFRYGLLRSLLPQTGGEGASALYAIRGARGVHEGRQPADTLGVTVLDRFTLEITLERPLADDLFLYALTQSVAMPCNQTYFEATGGRYGLAPKYLLSNGPFFLNIWNEASMRLTKNDGYQGEAPVAPAAVILLLEPDDSTRAQSLGGENGYDAAVVSGEIAESMGFVERGFAEALPNGTLSFVFNCSRAPGNNAALRTALCTALDAPALGFPAPPSLLPEHLRIGGGTLRSLVSAPKALAHDPARAQALLEESGLSKASLTLLCQPQHELLCRRALQQWQSVFGMALSVSIEPEEPEAYAKRLKTGDFDLAVTTLQAWQTNALQALESLVGTGGAGNLMRYDSSKLRTILEAAQTQTPLEAARACRSAEEHLLQNGVVYPLAPQASYLIRSEELQGLRTDLFFAGLRK